MEPTDITWHQFSRKRFGGVDPGEVRAFLAVVAAQLNRTASELTQAQARRADAERALRDAAARSEELAKKLAVAEAALSNAEAHLAEVREELAVSRQKLAVFEDRDSLAAGVLLNTQKIAEHMLQTAREQAGQILAATQADAERMVAEAQDAAAQTRAEADEHVADLATRVSMLLAVHDEFNRNIDVARTRHGELLEALAQLRTDTRRRVLPLLERSQRILDGEPEPENAMASPADATPHVEAAPHAETDAAYVERLHADQPQVVGPQNERAPNAGVTAAGPLSDIKVIDGASSAAPAPAEAPSAAAAAPNGNGEGLRGDAELIVSPFTSFLDVTKFLTALFRLTGVRKARLRTFSQGTATFDVALAGAAGLDVSCIEGYPLDVIERVGTRLVLRRPTSPTSAGA